MQGMRKLLLATLIVAAALAVSPSGAAAAPSGVSYELNQGNVGSDTALRIIDFKLQDTTVPTNTFVQAEVVVENHGAETKQFELQPVVYKKDGSGNYIPYGDVAFKPGNSGGLTIPRGSTDAEMEPGEQRVYSFSIKINRTSSFQPGQYRVNIDDTATIGTVGDTQASQEFAVRERGSVVGSRLVIDDSRTPDQFSAPARFHDGDANTRETAETNRIPPLEQSGTTTIKSVARGNLIAFQRLLDNDRETDAVLREVQPTTGSPELRIGLLTTDIKEAKHHTVSVTHNTSRELDSVTLNLVDGRSDEIDEDTTYKLNGTGTQENRVFQLSGRESEYISDNGELFVIFEDAQGISSPGIQKIDLGRFQVNEFDGVDIRSGSSLEIENPGEMTAEVGGTTDPYGIGVGQDETFYINADVTNTQNQAIVESINIKESGTQEESIVRTTEPLTFNPGETQTVRLKFSRSEKGQHTFSVLGEEVVVGVGSSVDRPPRVSVSTTPNRPSVGDQMTFDASSSLDPERAGVSYEWDIDNDGLYDEQIGNQIATKQINSRGQQQVSVRVTDDGSRRLSTEADITFSVEVEPVARASGYYYSSVDEQKGDVNDELSIDEKTISLISRSCDAGAGCTGRIGVGSLALPTASGINMLIFDEEFQPVFYGAYDVSGGTFEERRPVTDAPLSPSSCSSCASRLTDAIGRESTTGYTAVFVGGGQPAATTGATQLYNAFSSLGANMDPSTGTLNSDDSWLFISRITGNGVGYGLKEEHAPSPDTSGISEVRTTHEFTTVNVTDRTESVPPGATVFLDGSRTTDADSATSGSGFTYEWDVDDDGVYEKTGQRVPIVTAASATGQRTVTLKATDQLGLSSTSKIEIGFGNDNPTAVFDAPGSAPSGTTVQLDATGSYDIDGTVDGYSWRVAGSTLADTSPRQSLTFSSPGVKDVVLTVTGSNGEQDSAGAQIDVTNQAPQPAVTTGRVGFEFAADETPGVLGLRSSLFPEQDSGLMYTIENDASEGRDFKDAGKPYQVEWARYENPGSNLYSGPVPSGVGDVQVDYEVSGESAENSGMSVFLDGAAPTRVLDCVGTVPSGTISVPVPSCSNPIDQPETTTEPDGSLNTLEYQKTKQLSPAGYDNFYLASQMGNTPGAWSATMETNKLRVTRLESSDTDFPHVYLDASDSTDNGVIQSYEWDIGNNNVIDKNGPKITKKFSKIGATDIRLKVTDGEGTSSETTFSVQVDDVGPTAKINLGRTTVPAGTDLNLDGSPSADPTNNIDEYKWLLGDGNARYTGQTQNKAFKQSGTYEVSLVVKDQNGHVDSASKTVTVTNTGPTADITLGSSVVAVGTQASIDAKSSSDPNGDTLDYSWSLDNGGSDTRFDYFKNITVTEESGESFDSYQIPLTVDTAQLISDGKMNADCSDIRFTDQNGDRNAYFVESGCGGTSTELWVNIGQLGADETRTIRMWYGNGAAENRSSGVRTFEFYDSFEDGRVGHKWTDKTTTDAFDESGGRLEITDGNIHTNRRVVEQPGTMVEAEATYTSSFVDADNSGLMIGSPSQSGGNSNADVNVLQVVDDDTGQISTWAADGTTTSYNICRSVDTFTASQGQSYTLGIYDNPGQNQIETYKNTNREQSCNGDLTSLTDTSVIGLGHYALSENNDGTDISYDWVRARQHASQAPTVLIGSERQQPPAITNSSGDITFTPTITGQHRVKLTAEDDEGQTDTTTEQLTVDNTKPTAEYDVQVVGDNEIDIGDRAQFDASASSDDDGHAIEYLWDFGDDGYTDKSGSKVKYRFTQADIDVSLTVIDEHGQTDTTTKEFVLNRPPTIPSASELSFNGKTNLSETQVFSVTATDPDADDLTYKFVFNDGDDDIDVRRTIAHDTPTSVTNPYSTGGLKTLEVIVEDSEGVTATDSLTVELNEPPTIESGISVSGNNVTSETQTFDVTASDPNGDSLSYTWDFDDGNIKTGGSSISHSYSNAGNYTVSVTVSDGVKSVTDTKEISIRRGLIDASGGQETAEYQDGGKTYRIHAFKNDGTFTVNRAPAGKEVDVLIVGGGGGGAGGYSFDEGVSGGGGGEDKQFLRGVTTTDYTISVGSGGSGGGSDEAGNDGGSSSAFGITSNGGFGAGAAESDGGNHGSDNFVGGDHAVENSGASGAADAGGGGGGATQDGGDSTGDDAAGDGGNGKSYTDTFGTTFGDGGYFGGGGGGGVGGDESGATEGTGGLGGGGDGANGQTGSDNSAGQANTGGGGGGGAGTSDTHTNGADGGSGIVLIRYEIE